MGLSSPRRSRPTETRNLALMREQAFSASIKVGQADYQLNPRRSLEKLGERNSGRFEWWKYMTRGSGRKQRS